MSRPFLTARWCDLILANYPIEEDFLVARLPKGLEPDRFEGRCWVSLVGFRFEKTRVFGIGWPGFRQFPEWNLRAYVRCGSDRGVIFVREYVESRWVSWVARQAYNEPYMAAPMSHRREELPAATLYAYRVFAGERWHELSAEIHHNGRQPQIGSSARFFTDQSWGFGRSSRGQLSRYAVKHPLWSVETVEAYQIDVDWDRLYGAEWSHMNDKRPHNVLFAAGSDVGVYPSERIEIL